VIKKTGKYRVVTTNNWGCSTFSDEVSVIYSGATKLNSIDQFTVFPNPTMGMITVSMQSSFHNDIIIEILNNLGIVLQSVKQAKNGKRCQIDLSAYPSGIYLIKINT